MSGGKGNTKGKLQQDRPNDPSLEGQRSERPPVDEAVESTPLEVGQMISTTKLGKVLGVKALPYLFEELLRRGYIERPDKRYVLTTLGMSSEIGGRYGITDDGAEFVTWPVTLSASLFPLKQELLNFVDFRLFHMTHIENLKSIVEHGLHSHNSAPDYHDISNPAVNNRRERTDPIHNQPLHEYVPMYFNPRNAMLFQKQAEYKSDIVILEVDRRACLSNYTLFTERNAASDGCRFVYCPSEVKTFLWPRIYSRDWSADGVVNVETKQLMMSECLVYRHIGAEYLSAIHTANNLMATKIRSVLADIQHPKIHVSPELFF